jgi:aldose 1-epimerase
VNLPVLDSGRLRLTIAPALGAGIADLSIRRTDDSLWPILRPTPPGATWFNDLACYILAPWPNRIVGGRFTWHNHEFSVRPDWPDGAAIHGLVKDHPWHMVSRSPVSATLEFHGMVHAELDFPWRFDCTARYEIADDTLIADLTVLARGPATPAVPASMPVGLGFHPFFCRTLWDQSDHVAIRCALRGRFPAERMIPTGSARPDSITEHLQAGRPLGDLALDDVFLGSADGATITWPGSGIRATFGCSRAFGHTVVYTGEPDAAGKMPPFFCLEPVTLVNDGFNLAGRGERDTGIVSLNPGGSLHARWTLRIQELPHTGGTLS